MHYIVRSYLLHCGAGRLRVAIITTLSVSVSVRMSVSVSMSVRVSVRVSVSVLLHLSPSTCWNADSSPAAPETHTGCQGLHDLH